MCACIYVSNFLFRKTFTRDPTEFDVDEEVHFDSDTEIDANQDSDIEKSNEEEKQTNDEESANNDFPILPDAAAEPSDNVEFWETKLSQHQK